MQGYSLFQTAPQVKCWQVHLFRSSHSNDENIQKRTPHRDQDTQHCALKVQVKSQVDSVRQDSHTRKRDLPCFRTGEPWGRFNTSLARIMLQGTMFAKLKAADFPKSQKPLGFHRISKFPVSPK